MREMRLGIAIMVTRAYCCCRGNVMCRLCQMDDVDKCCGFGIGKAWEMLGFLMVSGERLPMIVFFCVCVAFLTDRDYV